MLKIEKWVGSSQFVNNFESFGERGGKFHGKVGDKAEKFIASNPRNHDQLRTD
jgi:hypothetical protein